MTKTIKVEIKKLVTMAELGLGAERPLNKEKRNWIKGLTKNKKQKPILVSPIKDSGYYVLLDGWHRVQALKKQKQKTALALKIPVKQGLQLARANKILRDVDKESKYKLKVSGLINDWAEDQIKK
jgi:intergrase/recombinase|tara:strand:- start:24 stop:398 length:375 start_codon:yes stop_codon:yes gene_type:complete